jgi:hypothetical protein
MAFSLTYAFGAKGRHIRKISGEARAFVGAKFRNLEPSRLRDYLFAQYFAIDGALFAVFYNDEPSHPLYSIHTKYGNKLLDATECDFRHLGLAYAYGLLAGQPLTSATEEEMAGRLNILHAIAFIYDGGQPPQLWISLVLKPDDAMIAAALCHDIAKLLQLDPRDKTTFSNDWLSLVPSIIAGTNVLLTRRGWSESAASLIQSVDFGGTQH